MNIRALAKLIYALYLHSIPYTLDEEKGLVHVGAYILKPTDSGTHDSRFSNPKLDITVEINKGDDQIYTETLSCIIWSGKLSETSSNYRKILGLDK